MASVLKVPVVFVCENNEFGVGSRICNVTNQPDLAKRAISYNIPGEIVDGQDVFAVYDIARKYVDIARRGGGPALLEMKTWRYGAHFSGEPKGLYRAKEEEERWLKRDPLEIGRKKMLARKLITEKKIEKLERDIEAELDTAVEFARNSPDPELETAVQGIYA